MKQRGIENGYKCLFSGCNLKLEVKSSNQRKQINVLHK